VDQEVTGHEPATLDGMMIARVDAWLDTFEQPDGGPASLDEWMAPDAVFVEHPNLVNPGGGERDRDAMEAGLEAGRALLARQAYSDRRHVVAGPGIVVTRTRWEGELAIDAGPWSAGTVLAADIAMFVELGADGRIRRQENYDCYLPTDTD
jgi:hypothetical protein